MENGLGLTSVSLLLPVVAPLALRVPRRLAGLVLRHLVRRVLLAPVAERLSFLGHVHHSADDGNYNHVEACVRVANRGCSNATLTIEKNGLTMSSGADMPKRRRVALPPTKKGVAYMQMPHAALAARPSAAAARSSNRSCHNEENASRRPLGAHAAAPPGALTHLAEFKKRW